MDVRMPDGTVINNVPDGTTQTELLARYSAYQKLQEPKEAPDTGFTGAIKSSYYKLKGDTALTLGKLGVMDTGEAEKYSKEQDQQAKDSFAPTKEGWTEAPFQKFKETLGGSLPYMAAPLAAGVAGAVGLPGAAIAGIGAGTLAAFGTGVAQFTGSNLDRQMETGKSLADTSLLQAGATAVPQAAFDILSLRMMPLVRGIFSKAGVKITENVAEEVTKKGFLATAGEYAAVTGKTMGMEGSTEAAQQFLERLQAGLNLTDEEARKEYFENFIGGAVLGGAIAIPGRAIEKLGARKPEAPAASTDSNFPAADPNAAAPPGPVVPPPDGSAAALVAGAAPSTTSERLSIDELISGVAGEAEVPVDPLEGEYQRKDTKETKVAAGNDVDDIDAKPPEKPAFSPDAPLPKKIEKPGTLEEVQSEILRMKMKMDRGVYAAEGPIAAEKAAIKLTKLQRRETELVNAAPNAPAAPVIAKPPSAPVVTPPVKITPAEILARAEEAQRVADANDARRTEEIRLAGVKAEEEARVAEEARAAEETARVKAEEEAKVALSATIVKPQGDELAAQIKAVEEKIALFKTGSRAKVVVGLRNDLKALKAQQAGVDDGATPQDGAGTIKRGADTTGASNGVSGPASGGASTPEIEPEGVDVDTAATAGLDEGKGIAPAPLTPEQEKEKGYIERVAQTIQASKARIENMREKVKDTADLDTQTALTEEIASDTFLINVIEKDHALKVKAYNKKYNIKEKVADAETAKADQANNSARNKQRELSEANETAADKASKDMQERRKKAALDELNENQRLKENEKVTPAERVRHIENKAQTEQEIDDAVSTVLSHNWTGPAQSTLSNFEARYALAHLVDIVENIKEHDVSISKWAVDHATPALAYVKKFVPERHIASARAAVNKFNRRLEKTSPKEGLTSEQKENALRNKLQTNYNKRLDQRIDELANLENAINLGWAREITARKERVAALNKDIKKVLADAKENGISLDATAANLADIRTGEIKPARSPERAEGESLGVEKVQSIVDELKAIWESAPEIKVVQRIRDLPARIAQRLLDGGWEKTPGLFDPQTQRVYLIADNLIDRAGVYYTTVHEVIGHYGLRQVLGDNYKGVMNNAYFNSAIKQVADKRRAEDPSLSKEESVEEAIAELSEKQYGKNTGIRNVVDKIVLKLREWARKLFGPDVFKGMSDAELRQLVAASGSLIENGRGLAQSTISPETKTIMRSAARLRAGIPSTATAEEIIDSFGSKSESYVKPGKIEQIAKAFSTRDTYTNIVRIFQNSRVVLKQLQEGLERSGKAIFGEENFNDIYNRVTLSTGKAFDLMKRHVGQGMETVDKTILEYVKASGLSMKDALNRLQAYSTAFHEQERRAVKYMLTVPLSNAKTITLPRTANKISPADYREKIIADLKTDGLVLTDAQAKSVRAKLDDLAKNHADPAGKSPNGYTSIDVNDAMNTYGVIGGFNKAHVDTLKNFYNNQEPNKAILEKLFGRGKVGDANYMEGAIKQVQNGTTELERIANYWSPQVDNFVKVYGYEHYVPFKGKPDTDSKVESDITNPRSLTKELVEVPNTTEGRISDSDNPVLQTLVDAAKGAMRAGRKDVTQAIKNSIQQGHIIQGVDKNPTKPIFVVPFKDRYTTDWSLYSKPNNILHYTPEGTIEVYSIASRSLRESIRRTYEVTNPFVDLANQITSGVGQMHTRYNPSFSPLNFVRDTLTNSFTMGAEKGMSKATGLLDATARSVWDNGLWKAGKVSLLYAQGDMNTLDSMAANDPFIKDIIDYLQEGGRVSHIQGLAAKGAFNELMKDASRSKLILSKEKFDNYVDVWSNAFELTARVSAYRVMKSDLLAKGTPAAEAQRLAVAYSKNLANFEQVGEWGKGAGAFFMFFRPAATGAVRALDALMPAWESVESLVARLPESVRTDTTKNAEGLTPVEVYRKNHAELKKNARVMAAALLGAGVSVYMMALMMAGGDELDRNKVVTDDMARWTRYARLPVPGTDTFIQVPWGYGLGSFAAWGAQLASVGFGKNTMGNAMGNMLNIALDSFLPLPVSRMSPVDNFLGWAIDSSLPSVARPFVEYVMNVDSLGRKIYNDRLSRYADSYAGGDNIPTIYKKTAMLLMDVSNGSLDISPNTLYFFANNYIDGAARIAQNTAETGMFLAGSTEFNPKSNLITTTFDSFIGSKSNYDAREFSAIEAKIKEKERILKTFKESNPSKYADYLSAHPLDTAIVEIYNKQVGGALQKSREMSNIIRRMPDMSEKDKMPILRNLTLTQNMLKRGMIDTFKAYDLTP